MRTYVPFRNNHNLVYSRKYHQIRRIRIVWCPKYRRPGLVNEVESRLKGRSLLVAPGIPTPEAAASSVDKLILFDFAQAKLRGRSGWCTTDVDQAGY